MTAAKKLGALLGAALSGLYLMNLGAGFIELGPDNAPLIGNLDEIVATIVLLRCLTSLGIDTRRWVGPRSPIAAFRSIDPQTPKNGESSTSRNQ